ncbi:MAG: nitrate- and nitrite sensing domain-containing protein [Rhodospirillales bacterium]|nr:nitrate- and nitrite sensing domain-containing protein [Rhodospirillales bacterium]MCW8952852.1 nitrate- and nitrite sensing domain-containing protein [Rhodospirillales bacterium]MCW9003080.1 nitrate- and nitrite sensing domain-containing protein [Rhodospirillales bacterium]
MSGFLKNMKIKGRVALALVLPIAGMLIFSAMEIRADLKNADSLEKVQKLAVLGPQISALVHEMQKERGLSAGFIGSKGVNFAKELPEQRKDTDAKRVALLDALKRFDAKPYGASLAGKIDTAVTAIGELDAIRGEISELKRTVPEMAKYYTGTIAKQLTIVEEMAVLSTNAEVTNMITAYTTFLQGKERAGIERAMGAGGFGAGKFAPPVYRNFLQLIAMQSTYLATFNIYATQGQRDFLKETLKGPEVDEVERLRQIAIDSPETGNTGDVAAPHWFKTITAKINLLKVVEDRVATDLEARATELAKSAMNLLILLAAITAILLGVTAVLVIAIVGSITKPIGALTGNMSVLAGGDTSVEVLGVDRGDEIGDMAKALEVFKENRIAADRMAEEQAQEQAAKQKRAEEMEKLTKNFQNSVTGILQSVGTATDGMKASSQAMAATAEETSRQSGAVAAASEEASANVQTVASASEELSASIQEISRQVSQSTQIASNAVHEAEKANEMVQSLATAANKIGEVVALITDIAEQTNLLALNATIEAARAGEAGKGFAVVASEVKNLANQTAKATEEISAQIGGIQTATQNSVEAIGGITETISQINEISSAIAAAVEEQGAATQEIARNVEQASAGTTEVSSNIQGVSQAAGETGETATRVMDATNAMTEQTETLRKEIESFLKGINQS